MLIDVLADSPQEEVERLDDICFSICMNCGQDLRFDTVTIDEDLVLWFTCGECHTETDMDGFLGNVTFTEPIACIMCGFELKFWDISCFKCSTEFSERDWAEYVAFMFDVGEYGACVNRMDAFIKLQENIMAATISPRDNYNMWLKTLAEIEMCFVCGGDLDTCTCSNETHFFLNHWVFVPDNIKSAFFYHDAITLPNSRYEQSCYNCKKQFTSKCEKLPEQLLTIGPDHRPAYKLDTCEYIEVDTNVSFALDLLYQDSPDDGAPF